MCLELYKTVPNNLWAKKKRNITIFFELDEKYIKIYKKLWDVSKAVLGGKFIALKTYIRKDIWS